MYAEGLSRGRDAQSAGGGEGPGGTGGAVFDCDAGGGESVANLVCLCEILVFTGFGAGGELRVDEFAECFERAGVAAGLVAAVNPRTGKRVETERVEHRAHIDERGDKTCFQALVGIFDP